MKNLETAADVAAAILIVDEAEWANEIVLDSDRTREAWESVLAWAKSVVAVGPTPTPVPPDLS